MAPSVAPTLRPTALPSQPPTIGPSHGPFRRPYPSSNRADSCANVGELPKPDTASQVAAPHAAALAVWCMAMAGSDRLAHHRTKPPAHGGTQQRQSQRPLFGVLIWPLSVDDQAPTTGPTARPTAAPSERPSSQPSLMPTAQPTSLPTSQPTTAPSTAPTAVRTHCSRA